MLFGMVSYYLIITLELSYLNVWTKWYNKWEKKQKLNIKLKCKDVLRALSLCTIESILKCYMMLNSVQTQMDLKGPTEAVMQHQINYQYTPEVHIIIFNLSLCNKIQLNILSVDFLIFVNIRITLKLL